MTSIVLHEAVHHRDDIPANMTYISLGQPFDLRNSIPVEFDNYLRDLNSYGDNSYKDDYQNEVTITSIYSPEYYLNEINAYQKEIALFPNVSAKYDVERRYMLWRSQQLYELAKNNYPQ